MDPDTYDLEALEALLNLSKESLSLLGLSPIPSFIQKYLRLQASVEELRTAQIETMLAQLRSARRKENLRKAITAGYLPIPKRRRPRDVIKKRKR
jgi:hypothetical protein